MKKKTFLFTAMSVFILMLAALFTGCFSVPVVVPEDQPMSYYATKYGLTVGENESIVVIVRQSAREASSTKNARINNDFQIRFNGIAVTTFGGGKENAATIQLDSVFGSDTETVFVVPNGTYTLDIFGRAGGLIKTDYQSNEVGFTANSSVITFSVIWRGLISPTLIVDKVRDITPKM